MLSKEERVGVLVTLIGGSLLAVGLLALLGFFSDSATPARARAAGPVVSLGRVTGRVVDRRTRLGIAAPTISVQGFEGVSDHWVAEADPEQPGVFEILGLPLERPFNVCVAAPGYAATHARAAVTEATGTTSLPAIELTPLVTIVGEVVDAAGQPVADVLLDVWGESCTNSGWVSDAHGHFRCEGLVPSNYTFDVPRTPQRETLLVPVWVDARNGGEQLAIRLEIVPSFTVRARFVFPIGGERPVRVDFCNGSVVVAPDGSFTLEGVRAGPVRWIARFADGRAIAGEVGAPAEGIELPFDPELAARMPEIVDLADDPRSVPTPSASPDGGVLVVRVVDGAGAGLCGARIELTPATAELPFVRYANRDGVCVWRGLPPGSYASIRVLHGLLTGERTEPFELAARRTLELPPLVCEPPPLPPPPALLPTEGTLPEKKDER